MANGTVMPATRNNGQRQKSLLEQAILPAILGLGAGASLRQGNITPLVNAGAGFLTGQAAREQREAEAAAKAEQDRLDREFRERQLEPKFSLGPQGPTFSNVPLSAFGAGDAPTPLPDALQPDALGFPGGAGFPDSGFGAAGTLDSPMAQAFTSPKNQDLIQQIETLQKQFPATPKPPRTFTDPVAGGLWIEDPETLEWRRVEGPALKPAEPPERATIGGTIFERSPEGEWQVAPGAPEPATGGSGQKPPAEIQKAIALLPATRSAFDRYARVSRNFMTKNPFERGAARLGLGSQKEFGEVEGAKNTLLLSLKELGNLGVLTGPDVDIVTGIIGDATSRDALIRGSDYVESKLAEAEAFINERVAALQQTYPNLNIQSGGSVTGGGTGAGGGGAGDAGAGDLDAVIEKMVRDGATDAEISAELQRRQSVPR